MEFTQGVRFDSLGLLPEMTRALEKKNIEWSTPVQAGCIPPMREWKDVIAKAPTGTGKTFAFGIPIIEHIDPESEEVQAVIMAPTRELAMQITAELRDLAVFMSGIRVVCLYGGAPIGKQIDALKKKPQIVVATPGRLSDHMKRRTVRLDRVQTVVLDEADRMLDMGFSDDILTIAKGLPKDCQTIMFSATMPKKIEDLANSLLKDPVVVKLAVSKPAERIQQSAYVCYEPQKLGIIRDIFKKGDLKRVIIFSGKKTKVKEINRAFIRMHINSGEMHSDLTQAERDEIMFKFKSGQIDVLVATDIVARGIDIDDVSMVINYDVPHDVEDYVHRIGRTARADKAGVAITLVSDDDMYYFQQIEKFLEKRITKNPLPKGLGEGPEYKPVGKPSAHGRGRGQHKKANNQGGKGKKHSRLAQGGKDRNRSHNDRKKATAPVAAPKKHERHSKPVPNRKIPQANKD